MVTNASIFRGRAAATVAILAFALIRVGEADEHRANYDMKLERIQTYPSAKQALTAPVGTTYVYRRYLIFGPQPLWFVVMKLGPDRWVRAQSTTSLEDALATIEGGGSGHTRVVDDVDSKKVAKLVTRKEVEADGTEKHVGLFVGVTKTLPTRQERPRPDAGPIAAARKAAATKAGAAALAKQLASHRPERGATKKQLDALARAIGKVPPDLAQLLRWSNGHRKLQLMSIEGMIAVHEFLEEPSFLAMNQNENGDHWGLLLTGPLRGALVYGECELADPDVDSIMAPSILAWVIDMT